MCFEVWGHNVMKYMQQIVLSDNKMLVHGTTILAWSPFSAESPLPMPVQQESVAPGGFPMTIRQPVRSRRPSHCTRDADTGSIL